MDAREIPEPFLPLSSTSSSSLQLPASFPVAQFHHDGYGSDSVSDRDRGPSHLIHTEHQFSLGPYTPRGPFWHQDLSPYAHSRAPGVAATVDVAGDTFGPTYTFRAPSSLEFAQTRLGARDEATFQHPGAVLHPSTARTTSATSFPTGYGNDWNAALEEVGGYRAGGLIPVQGINIHDDARFTSVPAVAAMQSDNVSNWGHDIDYRREDAESQTHIPEHSSETLAQSSASFVSDTSPVSPSVSLSAQLPDSHSFAMDDKIRGILGLEQNAPLSLKALLDPSKPDERPCHTILLLAQLAILGSSDKRLTKKGICEALGDRFEWYRANQKQNQGWQNTVARTLTDYNCFVRVRKPTSVSDKGDFWALDYSESNSQERRRTLTKRNGRGEPADTDITLRDPQAGQRPWPSGSRTSRRSLPYPRTQPRDSSTSFSLGEQSITQFTHILPSESVQFVSAVFMQPASGINDPFSRSVTGYPQGPQASNEA